MAETKKLKSIKFPGLEDTYTIPQKLSDLEWDIDTGNGVGKATDENGEIFNDYENNKAVSSNTHAEGQMTHSGVKGYPILPKSPIPKNTAGDRVIITLNDSEFEEKAVVQYAVGDKLQLDLTSGHYYNRLEITSVDSNDNGETVIEVKDLMSTTASALTLTFDSTKTDENYVWVVGKNCGEVFPMAYGAHAEGELTLAMGRAAHAEGREAQAIGNYAHAEGRKTIANYLAHAEGLSTKAIGGQSHAEGNKSEAIGSDSHAEGFETKAIGNRAHAEGYRTQANFMAHAEGQETQAIGEASHAEGFKTSTEGAYSHAEGRESKAMSSHSHAEGFRTTTLGVNSHAEGVGAEASGTASHAEGSNTQAKGTYSHAEGEGTIARAIGSHVQGRYNKEDTGLKFAHIVGGGSSDADRKDIHTLDWSGNAVYSGKITVGVEPTEDMDLTTKKYVDSLFGGDVGKATDENGEIFNDYENNKATGIASHAEGINTTASGQGAHSQGGSTQANGDYSHAEGFETTATGNCSHAEGDSTKASGKRSHAEGGTTTAKGDYAHAEGCLTVAEGGSAHAEGCVTHAKGTYSHAEGYDTLSEGNVSHAEGYMTHAKGYYSHAEGRDTQANGQSSHAEGWGTIVSSEGGHVQGRFNIEDTEYKFAHIVGGGYREARKNIHTVDWSGNAWYAGKITAGANPTEAMDLATKDYIDTIIAELPKIYSGTEEPDNFIGKDGDIYIMYEE